METYLVGGAVRDRLLGLPVYDRDWVVVGASAEAMTQRGYQPVGKDFPVFLHPKTKEEYALARTERKSGHGYKGFEFYASPEVTLEQDLERRDLTINAMAEDASGRLIDPFEGQRDLRERRLRHVSEAFSEDPLRVLRVARFYARLAHLGFSVADDTLLLMRRIAASGELQHLTAERVWSELERALGEPSPHCFFLLLHDSHALAELLPELDDLFAPDRSEAAETLARSAQLRADPQARLAALCFHIPDAEAPLDAMLERLKAPKAYRDLSLLLHRHGRALLSVDTLSPSEQLGLYRTLDLQRRPQRLPLLLQACRALTDSHHAARIEQAVQRIDNAIQSVQPAQLAAAGFKGKQLGKELQQRQLQALSAQAPQ